MAKKSSDMRIKNFDDLNDILKNSFSGIKQDIQSMSENIHFIQSSVDEARKTIEDSKKDYVTVDKINSFKIKLADLNEEVKRLDRIEAAINKVNEKVIDTDKFESERAKTKEKIDELQNQVILIEKVSKGAVTEVRLKQLAKEVSAEINEMVKKLETYEKKGGDVVNNITEKFRKEIDRKIGKIDENYDAKSAVLLDEISKKASQMSYHVKKHIENEKKETNKKLLKLLDGINNIREENKKLVTKNQVNEVLRNINSEFDEIKENVEDLKLLKKDIKSIMKEKLNKNSYENQIDDMNKRFEKIEHSIEHLKQEVKVNGELQKEFVQMSRKMAKPRIFSTLVIANMLIVIAFLLLAGSFGMYFYERTYYMNYVITGAVVFFIAGIVLRIVSVIRE